MAFPLEKYHFYTQETKDGVKKIIAVSTYAGKIVRGVAKCAPGDEYDEEKGKRLAAARCNARIAAKRQARAYRKCKEALAAKVEADRIYKKMYSYFCDSCASCFTAQSEEEAIALTLKA